VDYLTIAFGNYLSDVEGPFFAYYLPLESTQFDKLQFPADGKVVWTKDESQVLHKNDIYYGIYHGELVKGIYNTKKNVVTNLIRDPTKYFNICIGVIDYLFSKLLLNHGIFRIHAACASQNNQALLICGTSGTGKTTLLMKLLKEGFHFISDDSVYLQFQNDQLICIPFPKVIIANYNDLQDFPTLYKNLEVNSIFTSYGEHKALIQPMPNNFQVDINPMPVNKVIIPVISENNSAIFDIVDENLKFNLMLPSCSGKDLLNIDYIKDINISNKQSDFCHKITQIYPLKIFKMGPNFSMIQNGGHLL